MQHIKALTQRFPRVAPLFLLIYVVTLGVFAGCAGDEAASSSTSATTSTGGGEGGSSTATTSSSTSSTASAGGAGGEGGQGQGGTGGQGGSGGEGEGGSGGEGGGGGPVGTAEYPLEVESNNLDQTANPLADGTKGFTASIGVLGDVDTFSVDVTIPGSSLRVEASDGAGGCPSGSSLLVKVSGPGGFLASDTSSGPTGCPLLTATAYPTLSDLSVGTYYVQVENQLLATVASYVLAIQTIAPGCGDGVIQLATGEQCDDANLMTGDGCDDVCHIENLGGTLLTEAEPNDTFGTAQDLSSASGVVGSISPVGDQDFYVIDVPVAGSALNMETSDGFGGCPINLDTKIYLYDPNLSQIAFDDDSGAGACSALAVTNLPAGTYFVLVEDYGNNDTAPFYVFGYSVSAPFCGDGILQVGETCDDGNMNDNDGCSSACVPEAVYIQEVEPNSTAATAQPLGVAIGILGAITPIGDKDFFSFDVTVPGSSIIIQVSDGMGACPAFDSVITLYNPLGQLLVSNDQGDLPPCSTLKPTKNPEVANLPVGVYKVRLEESGNNALAPSYVLAITVLPPSCGDAVIQSGETCDDGNINDGDGCNSSCQVEASTLYEVEPNDVLASATSFNGYVAGVGAITPVGDQDYWSFTVPGNGMTATISVRDWAGNCPIGVDTLLYLYNGAGQQIGLNDDSGGTTCSSISMAGLLAGNYTARVADNGNNSTIPFYLLRINLQ